MNNNIVPVILAGGSGTRLWPVSRVSFPKQFCKLIGDQSLLQATVERSVKLCAPAHIIIVTSDEYYFFCKDQLEELPLVQGVKIHYILEPCGKNTAPAIAVAAQYTIDNISEQAKLFVMPSDHNMDCSADFSSKIGEAAQLADQSKLILFAINPTAPETGYGYIKKGDNISGAAYSVAEFVEKPDLEKAKQYLKDGGYFWNSGMFIMSPVFYLQELGQYSSSILQGAIDSYNKSEVADNYLRIDGSYVDCPSGSIDYEVIEKTDNTALFVLEDNWSDLGCWASLSKAMDSDVDGNVIEGDVVVRDCDNSFIMSNDVKVVALGLSDKIIVSTSDSVLVADKSYSQEVKKIVEELKANDEKVASEHNKMYRPWGSYETLSKAGNYHVKLIMVNPASSLSLQMHHHRSEHWVVISGVADIINGDQELTLLSNQSTYIEKEAKHRLTNNSADTPLVIVEVQVGDYLGEDDIVRFDDIYGRVK